jgi:hypothetical protein
VLYIVDDSYYLDVCDLDVCDVMKCLGVLL